MNNTGSDNIGKFLDTDNPKAVYYATTYHPAWWSKIDWALLSQTQAKSIHKIYMIARIPDLVMYFYKTCWG
jgi:hypothetical protein